MSIFKKKINDKIITVLFSILIIIVLYLNFTFERYASQIEKYLLFERNLILKGDVISSKTFQCNEKK